MNSVLRRVPAATAAALRSAKQSLPLSATRAAYPALSRGYAAKADAAKADAAKADAPSVIAEVKPGKVGEMPSILDQATGLERAEIDHPDLFKHNEVLRGPFGTAEHPVKIQSAYEQRIVGCTGKAAPDEHDLVWMNVEKGEQCSCEECGQVFELDPL